jgi:hypothetical protein
MKRTSDFSPRTPMTFYRSRSTGATSKNPVLTRKTPTTTTLKMGLRMELQPLTKRKKSTSNPCPRKRMIR